MGELLMYLVRHCLVDLDVEERIRGTQNVPLNEEGEEEAAELADFFRSKPLSAVYSDDLDRTYHTAIAIAEPHDLHVHKDVLLRSWDVGSDLEGKSIEQNKRAIKEFKLQPHLIPPGGESWGSAEERAAQTLEKYTRIAMERTAPIVVVLHGSLLQLICRRIGMTDQDAGYDSTPIEPSGVIAIYLGRSGYHTRVLRGEKVGCA
jgi:broad specificity phosphatase PhoE